MRAINQIFIPIGNILVYTVILYVAFETEKLEYDREEKKKEESRVNPGINTTDSFFDRFSFDNEDEKSQGNESRNDEEDVSRLSQKERALNSLTASHPE